MLAVQQQQQQMLAAQQQMLAAQQQQQQNTIGDRRLRSVAGYHPQQHPTTQFTPYNWSNAQNL